MDRIEALIRECGDAVAYAVDADGERVHPRRAHAAAGVRHDGDAHWCGGDDRAAWGATLDDDDRVVMPTAILVGCDVNKGTGLIGYIPAVTRISGRYGRPPKRFLPESLIGQVISRLASVGALRELVPYWDPYPAEYGPLGWLPPSEPPQRWAIRVQTGERTSVWARIPRDLVLAAAADHCIGAAYLGECPGVDPDEIKRWTP